MFGQFKCYINKNPKSIVPFPRVIYGLGLLLLEIYMWGSTECDPLVLLVLVHLATCKRSVKPRKGKKVSERH